MAKNKAENFHEIEEEDFDFELDDMAAFSDDGSVMADAMALLVKANGDQMHIALELTKLIIGQAGASEDKVLSTFTQASKTVAETSMLKDLISQLN